MEKDPSATNEMASDAVKKNTEVLLSSVLISAKDGVPLHHLAREFREVGIYSGPLFRPKKKRRDQCTPPTPCALFVSYL